jgi:hypothetical protein
MQLFVIGEPYIPELGAGEPLPQEGAEYYCNLTGHHLRLQFRHVTAAEIAFVSEGKGDFGVVDYDGVVYLLYRFGKAIPWNNAPFCYHLVPEEERWLPPDPKPGEGAWLQIHLVDAATNILEAMRALTFSTEFTRILHRLIREQATRPFDRDTHFRRCQQANKKWPRPEMMLPLALARYGTGQSDHAPAA